MVCELTNICSAMLDYGCQTSMDCLLPADILFNIKGKTRMFALLETDVSVANVTTQNPTEML